MRIMMLALVAAVLVLSTLDGGEFARVDKGGYAAAGWRAVATPSMPVSGRGCHRQTAFANATFLPRGAFEYMVECRERTPNIKKHRYSHFS